MSFGLQDSVRAGNDLPEIQTEQLGYQPLSGDCKLKLLPSPWPTDALPSPSSSLLAIASTKGLVAAAGPSDLILASTASIREAWTSGSAPENNIRPFNPKVKISVPRLSHIAFSADENVFVITAESSGGLVAYKTDDFDKGLTNPALQISTNNQALRALAPNPNVQFAELFALVTTNGELLIADLKSGQVLDGKKGKVLHSSVSCVSWSNLGKQLVAGRADGTAVQLTREGEEKAVIPRPPSLEGGRHVSTLSWLANDTFFIVYSPSQPSDGMVQPSDYFIVSRERNTQNYTFYALPEVCPAFGLRREPASHFVARLRKFDPHIEDLLLLASTTSFELGLVTKATAPLSENAFGADFYTLTMPADDSRRAQLPLSLVQGDTSPIGLALDLSATESIMNPIPSDSEIEQSSGPLPNVFALNHEGILSSWWIVYSDSIRSKTTYSGLAAAAAPGQPKSQNDPAAARIISPPPPRSNQPAFGQPAFGQSESATQKPPTQAPTSTFGGGSDTKFGSSNLLSGSKPSWTSTGFSGTSQTGAGSPGKPAFGTSTLIGGVAPAFGAPSPFAGRAVFGLPAATAPTSTPGTALGQSSGGETKANPFSGNAAALPFGGSGGDANGFSSFSTKQGGFAALGSDQGSKPNPFGASGATESPFARAEQLQPPAPKEDAVVNKSSSSGFGGANFTVGSTFKPDTSEKDSSSKASGLEPFSSAGELGDALNQNQQQSTPVQSKDAEMGDDAAGSVPMTKQKNEPAPLPPTQAMQTPLVTPPSTMSQPKKAPAPPVAGLFSTESQPETTPAAVEKSKPGWTFQPVASTTPQETPNAKPPPIPGPPDDERQSPKVKIEPSSGTSLPPLDQIPEALLPPEPTSKPSYTPGNSTDVSDESKPAIEDQGLPPTLVPKSSDELSEPSLVGSADETGGGLSSDFGDSCEDDAHDVGPTDEPTGDQTEEIQTSPESSFGKAGDASEETSPAGGLFTKVNTSKPSHLFGELTTGPILPPPVPQESPRSPSPVRNNLLNDILRPEGSRSIGSPAAPHSLSIVDKRRAELANSALASQSLGTSKRGDQDSGRAATAARARAKVKDGALGRPGEIESDSAAAVTRVEARARAEAQTRLEDDEDTRLRAELEAPPSPSERLEPFLHHRHTDIDTSNKAGIPGQIERLYRDINSMIYTVGINARSLSAYLLHETKVNPDKPWPDTAGSDTFREALMGEYVLQDITRLRAAERNLAALFEKSRIANPSEKFEQCRKLFDKDLIQLATKLSSTRKALHGSYDTQIQLSAPLSAEQSSLQNELRKASATAQSKLAEAEQQLTVLRARLSEANPPEANGTGRMEKGVFGKSSPRKKPTVEAVTSTITKMTVMAETKRTEVDVLEAQLRKMGIESNESFDRSRGGSSEPYGTPRRENNRARASQLVRTPMSSAGSVYYTPESHLARSIRSTPGTWQSSSLASVKGNGILDSADSERWKMKAKKRKTVHDVLREALAERRRTGGKSQA